MSKNGIKNSIVVGAVLLVLYLFAGHDFVKFYLGGKAELLEAAAQIDGQCDADGACPTTLPGWHAWGDGRALAQGSMLYFVDVVEAGRPQRFRLVYRFFMPDDWFEAEGGVNRPVSAGWKSRPEGQSG